jgi:uncharacterized membrane protein YgcG
VDESSRDFLARWINIKNSCENMQDIQAIDYFTEGLVRGTSLRHYLKRTNPQTLTEMITTASQFATADDDDARGAPLLKKLAGGKRKNSEHEAEIAYTSLPIMVPAPARGGGKGGSRPGGRGKGRGGASGGRGSQDARDTPCSFHSKEG